MCLACGMDDDEELWFAYQDYLEKRARLGLDAVPPDPSGTAPQPAPDAPRPAPTTFTCDET